MQFLSVNGLLIIFTWISLATMTNGLCQFPEDLMDVMRNGLRLKLLANTTDKASIRPEINVTRFHRNSQCPQLIKKIALQVDSFLQIRNTSSLDDPFFDQMFSDMDDLAEISQSYTQEAMIQLKKLVQKIRDKEADPNSLKVRKIVNLVVDNRFYETLILLEEETDSDLRVEIVKDSVEKLLKRKIDLKTLASFVAKTIFFDTMLAGYQLIWEELKLRDANNKLNTHDIEATFSLNEDVSIIRILEDFKKQNKFIQEGFARLANEIEPLFVKVLNQNGEAFINGSLFSPNWPKDCPLFFYTREAEVKESEFKCNDLQILPADVKDLVEQKIRSACDDLESLFLVSQKHVPDSSINFLHSWMGGFRRYLIKIQNFNFEDEGTLQFCQKKASLLKESASTIHYGKFMEVYRTENWKQIEDWAKRFNRLFFVLEDVILAEYKGNEQNIFKLIKLAETFSPSAACLASKTLVSEMVKYNKLDTFEAFSVFILAFTGSNFYAQLKSQTKNNIYGPWTLTPQALLNLKLKFDIEEFQSKSCKSTLELVPAWIQNLFFQNTTVCQIINRWDSSRLSVTVYLNKFYIHHEKTAAPNDHVNWFLYWDGRGVSFRNWWSRNYLAMGRDNIYAALDIYSWRVRGSTDGFFKIYDFNTAQNGTRFIALNPCGNAQVCVQTVVENEQDYRQDWKIQCQTKELL